MDVFVTLWGWDEGMTLLNSCQVLKSLACIGYGGNSIDWSIEQVSSPAGPSGRSRYMLKISVKFLPLYISPSSGLFFISPDEDLLFEVETSWVKLLCKFQCWRSELNWRCKRCQILILYVIQTLFYIYLPNGKWAQVHMDLFIYICIWYSRVICTYWTSPMCEGKKYRRSSMPIYVHTYLLLQGRWSYAHR